MRFRTPRLFALLVLLAPALFAQDFSIRAIESAVNDRLYSLAEQQIWRALSLNRSLDEETELTLLLIRTLTGQQRFDEAVILADESENLLQQDAFIYWKAHALFEAGNFDLVFQTLENLPGDSEYAPPALRLQGRTQQAAGDLKKAEASYERFSKKFPDHADAEQNLLDLATVQLDRDRQSAAEQTMKELLEQFPDSQLADTVRLLLARRLIAEKKSKTMERAAGLLNELGANTNAHARLRLAAWMELSVLQQKDGQVAAASDALLQAESLTSENALLVRQKAARAHLMLGEGKTQPALDLFDEAIRIAATDELAAEVLVQKADVLLEQGNFTGAEAAFQAGLNVTLENSLMFRALKGKGWSLWEQKRYEESAVAFEQAASACSNAADCATEWIKAGDARLAAGQFSKAHEDYYRVTELPLDHPLKARAMYQSGIARLKADDLESALQHFREVETIDPAGEFAPRAALQQAAILKAKNQTDDALAQYRRIAGRYTNDLIRADALHRQGLLLFETARYADALNAFESVVDQYPDAVEAPQAFYMRGFCRYQQGDTAAALEVFDEFILKHPDSPWTPQVLFLTGEQAYNRGDYAQANITFLDIADRFPRHELGDDSLYWAASAQLQQDNFLDAFKLCTRLAKEYPNSELLLKTRFAQGEALSELGEFSRAILAYEEIIKTAPDSPLADRARGRLGDCLFTLGSTDPDRYNEALDAYQALYSRPMAPFELKLQALFKIARSEDKSGRTEKAFAHYMEAVYSIDGQPRPLSPDTVLWFTRAALEAASRQELLGNWNEAVHIYERIIQAGVPARDEANKQIQKIMQDHPEKF